MKQVHSTVIHSAFVAEVVLTGKSDCSDVAHAARVAAGSLSLSSRRVWMRFNFSRYSAVICAGGWENLDDRRHGVTSFWRSFDCLLIISWYSACSLHEIPYACSTNSCTSLSSIQSLCRAVANCAAPVVTASTNLAAFAWRNSSNSCLSSRSIEPRSYPNDSIIDSSSLPSIPVDENEWNSGGVAICLVVRSCANVPALLYCPCWYKLAGMLLPCAIEWFILAATPNAATQKKFFDYLFAFTSNLVSNELFLVILWYLIYLSGGECCYFLKVPKRIF